MAGSSTTQGVTSVTKHAVIQEPGDLADNASTTTTLSVGDTLEGQILNSNDADWVRITLEAGQAYVFSAWGTDGNAGLTDTIVTLYDSNGNVVGTNDDLNSQLRFSGLEVTAPSSGTYYISVEGFGSNTGNYTLQTATDTYTPQQIATYLTEVDWGFTAPLRLDVQAGGTLTYNISNLNADGRQLAEWALEAWSIATGITFIESNSGSANILFDDAQSGAFAGPSLINPATGVSSQSTVNIGTSWLNTYGTTIDSYSFSTYLHEIGHALGLGHGGPYDGVATFGSDNLYANDSIQQTIMSYFNPSENPNVLGSDVEIISPQMADLVAMDILYGGTQIYQGNTIWGAGSNVGGWLGDLMAIIFDGAPANPNLYNGGPVGWTIRDTGGTDTIDVSTLNMDQRVDLRSERFSDINGSINNVAIAVGTVIENAIGGSGDDTLRGNEADNRLEGNAGNDTINGDAGTDTAVLDVAFDSVTVSQNVSGIHIVSALGTDTYRNIEFFEFSDGTLSAGALLNEGDTGGGNTGGGDTGGGDTGGGNTGGGGTSASLAGTPGPDNLVGTSAAEAITGQAGDDTISAGGGNDEIAASDGNDSVSGGGGDDNIGGGLGNDTINGGAGNDTVGAGQGNDNVIGGEGDDALYGGAGTDNISGQNGNDDIGAGFGADTLSGGAGNDSMGGGTGRDLINAGDGNDVVGGGEGDDTINGGTGSDFLAGGGRNDQIDGGSGADTINAGAGSDTITGGVGADTFVFNAFFNGDADIITDFQNGVDTIRMSGIDNSAGSRFDALDITAVAGGVELNYNGNTITLQGVSLSEIGTEDFIFV